MRDKPKYYGKSIIELISETQKACDKGIEQWCKRLSKAYNKRKIDKWPKCSNIPSLLKYPRDNYYE